MTRIEDRTPELNKALSALQGELPPFGDDQQREVTVEHKDGTSHSYKYVTLNTIMEVVGPLMAKHGLSFTALPGYNDPGDGKVTLSLRYRLAHSSGEEITGLFPLPGGDGSGTQGQRIQAMGSAISYARRYCLAAVLGVASEHDDDGQAAAALDEYTPATARRRAAATARDNQAAANTARRNRQAAGEEPAGPAEPVDPQQRPDPNGPITTRDQKGIFARFREVGLDQRGDEARAHRLEVAGDLIGRRLSSVNDLTSGQAGELIGVLDDVIAVGETVESRQDALEFAREAGRRAREEAEAAQ